MIDLFFEIQKFEQNLIEMAEWEGFEPSVRVYPVRQFSKLLV
jgi:hypothetical protein